MSRKREKKVGKADIMMGIGCVSFSAIILIAGISLWLARPPEWGIPGIVCFIIMALGVSGVSASLQMIRFMWK